MIRRRVALSCFAIVFVIPFLVAAPAAAEVSASVDPNEGLVDLQWVDLVLSDHTPGDFLGICQGVNDQCDLRGLHFAYADQHGEYRMPYQLRRFLHVDAPDPVDCADPSVSCQMLTASISKLEYAFVPLHFAPSPEPPEELGTVTVEPDRGLESGDTVTVSGDGFRAHETVEVMQCSADPSNPTECAHDPVLVVTDANGSFTTTRSVTSEIETIESVDCTAAHGTCVVAAAEVVDPAGTVVDAPVGFGSTYRPDGQFPRYGVPPLFDDVYSRFDGNQALNRRIAPGGTTTFVVGVQNDSALVDDIVISAPPKSGRLAVRYSFYGYDVTAAVTGDGFRIVDVAPGQTLPFHVQYRALATAPPGLRSGLLVHLISGSDLAVWDVVKVGVTT